MHTMISINNYYYPRGGADKSFLEKNRILERSGWRVVPFAMQHPQNQTTRWSEYFVEEVEFGQAYSLWGNARRAPKVIYSFEARRKLGRLLEVERPDIAHAHNIYHHISPSILGLLKQRDIPVVLTLHDLKLACPAYTMFTHDGICERCKGGALYNVVLHRCIKDSVMLSGLVLLETMVQRILGSYARNVDRFIVPSRFYLEKMGEWGWDTRRFRYIPNFVDTETHDPEFTPGSPFLYFGRLSAEKGLITLVKAAARAGVTLRIAGSGPKEQSLRDCAVATGANVEFLGHLGGERLHDEVRASRAVVLPSEWYENAPRCVLESYALGKPVIGANIGGIPELIKEDETGVLFRSGDMENLAETLCYIADLPDSRLTDMGRAGRRWMEKEFSATHHLKQLLGVYAELGVRVAA